MRDRDEYMSMLTAVGVSIATGVPCLLWGKPGEGKTAVIESACVDPWHVETLIVSHYEPSDFAGLPVVSGAGTVNLAPPQWAVRVAEHDGPALVFFDEWTTAAPAVQAAALRPLTHGEVGALKLPKSVSFAAAANPADVAAAGWELAPPTANRFVHLEWAMPIDVFSESLVTGGWPKMAVPAIPASIEGQTAAARGLVAGFVRARAAQLSAIPSDAASRGRAFPTPRTWDYTARLYAMAKATGADNDAIRLLVHGAIGAPTGHEFLAWVQAMDLPDPETVLADPGSSAHFAGMRPDRVHATLQGVLAAVSSKKTPKRWTAGVQACATAADTCGIDSAVPVVRSLLRERPNGVSVPPSIKVFAAPLALAGLLHENTD